MLKRFFRSLYWKISSFFLILLVITGGVNVFVTLFTSEMYVQEANQNISSTIAQNIVDKIDPFTDYHVNWSSLRKVFDTALMLNPGIEIYLLSSEGGILASSVPKEKIVRKSISLDSIKMFIQNYDGAYISAEDPLKMDNEKVFSAAPVLNESTVEGYIYVILRGEEYDSAMNMMINSYILQLGIRTFFITLFATCVMALLILRLMMTKLHRITEVVKRFEKGDLASRIPVKSEDELDQLADAFNSMASTIVGNIKELKNADAMRRELVANVSHDLRTPLASIQGYVETLLLKMGVFSHEKQKKYLEIVLESSQKLSTLVEELFTFSKLDTHQIKPKFESFPLAELVQDIVQKMQPQAQKSKIRLRGVFSKELPFVYADIGMIERVLQNLIDNAIRYTPEIGVVTVELVQGNDKIIINVSDTGEGIPEGEISFIFERFYRGKKENSRTSRGAGLGLAITKKIIETHQTTITVQSTVDAGTTFSFALPINNEINTSSA